MDHEVRWDQSPSRAQILATDPSTEYFSEDFPERECLNAIDQGPEALDEFLQRSIISGIFPQDRREAYRTDVFSYSAYFIKPYTKVAPWPVSGQPNINQNEINYDDTSYNGDGYDDGDGDDDGGIWDGAQFHTALENFAYITNHLRLFAFITMMDDDSDTWRKAVDRADKVLTEKANRDRATNNMTTTTTTDHLPPYPLNRQDIKNDMMYAIKYAPELLKAMLQYGGPYTTVIMDPHAFVQKVLHKKSNPASNTNINSTNTNRISALSLALRSQQPISVKTILHYAPGAPFYGRETRTKNTTSSQTSSSFPTTAEILCWLRYSAGDVSTFTNPGLGFSMDDLCKIDPTYEIPVPTSLTPTLTNPITANIDTEAIIGDDDDQLTLEHSFIKYVILDQYIQTLFQSLSFNFTTELITCLFQANVKLPNNTVHLCIEYLPMSPTFSWGKNSASDSPESTNALCHLFTTLFRYYPNTKEFLRVMNYNSKTNCPIEVALKRYPPICHFLHQNGNRFSSSFLQHHFWSIIIITRSAYLKTLSWLHHILYLYAMELDADKIGDEHTIENTPPPPHQPLQPHLSDLINLNSPTNAPFLTNDLTPLAFASLINRYQLIKFLTSFDNLLPSVSISLNFTSPDQSKLLNPTFPPPMATLWFPIAQVTHRVPIPPQMTLLMAIVLADDFYQPIHVQPGQGNDIQPQNDPSLYHPSVKPWQDCSGSERSLDIMISVYIESIILDNCPHDQQLSVPQDAIQCQSFCHQCSVDITRPSILGQFREAAPE